MKIKAAQFHVWCPLCSISRPFLKCHVSSACPWLWFPCLGPIENFQACPHLDPLVWVQWWWKICRLPSPLQKIQTLLLNLMCAAKKTDCWSCVVKVRELSSNSTLDGLTRNKRLTWVTYCMLYLKTHKQTKKLLMLKTMFQLFSILEQNIRCWVYISMWHWEYKLSVVVLMHWNPTGAACLPVTHTWRTASGSRGPF